MCWLKILSYFLTLKGSVIFWESLRFILERVFHDPSCFSHSPHPNSGHFPRAPYHSSHILASLSLLVPSFFSHLNYLFHLSKASYFQGPVNTLHVPGGVFVCCTHVDTSPLPFQKHSFLHLITFQYNYKIKGLIFTQDHQNHCLCPVLLHHHFPSVWFVSLTRY